MNKKQSLLKNNEYMDLIAELEKTQNALESAYSVFENVTEPDLIDCSIYQINAIQLRYKFLLERVKQFEPNTDKKSASAMIPDMVTYKYSQLML